MAKTDKVLVAIMNDRLDFNLAQDHHWYRSPVSSAEKWLKESWPPDWLAFYQTKIFADEKYSIRHFAKGFITNCGWNPCKFYPSRFSAVDAAGLFLFRQYGKSLSRPQKSTIYTMTAH